MSSPISTPAELSSSARRATGRAWRVVEAQHKVSTAKLTDTIAEQQLLEDILEGSKPGVPAECRHLHYLLATPFRYGSPYPTGSRFRRAGRTNGVFYASELAETAIAEMCFARLLFFIESPDTRWPAEAGEYTAFAVDYATAGAIDLTHAPFADRAAYWAHPTRYDECQELADIARASNIDLIEYASVRDPQHRPNLALLRCAAFACTEPVAHQTWRILLGANGARALCEMPRLALDFDRTAFLPDPRIAAMRWDR
jgi:hypothetical protein